MFPLLFQIDFRLSFFVHLFESLILYLSLSLLPLIYSAVYMMNIWQDLSYWYIVFVCITLIGEALATVSFTRVSFSDFVNFKPICESLFRETGSWSLHVKAYPRENFSDLAIYKSLSSQFIQSVHRKFSSNFLAKVSFKTLHSDPPIRIKQSQILRLIEPQDACKF